MSNFLNKKRALSLEGLDRVMEAQGLTVEQILPVDLVRVRLRRRRAAQRIYYEAFLKPGMPRIDVERELRQRSIHFRQNYEYGQYPKDEFILLKRIGSPVFYCSFEDMTLHLEFNATDRMGDPLTGISEYRALIDCL